MASKSAQKSQGLQTGAVVKKASVGSTRRFWNVTRGGEEILSSCAMVCAATQEVTVRAT